jgi:ABC-type polysaccharide/polyol phosphate transport system ATPase subunit
LPTSADGTIVVRDLWKRFRADLAKPRFSDQLARIGQRLRGKRDYRWVLKDINLEVEPGGTVGLIGINGSGKSTLLKIISGAMYPTAGTRHTYGRMGALLEVRGGIMPVLTGRENINMFGSVLGLSRRQINARFDTIVEFAEIQDAIDRQVKFYSSGMQVRLGFSIAAHLDADILLVDEILAVGDANFQQKCLRRISEVVANGCTLLFVSHDLASVEAMCDRTLWLTDAMVRAAGPTREVLSQYRGAIEEHAAAESESTSTLQVVDVEIVSSSGSVPRSGEDAEARLVLSAPEGGKARFYVGVSQGTAMPIFMNWKFLPFPAGKFEMRVQMRHLPLPKGRYYLWLAVLGNPDMVATQPWKPVGSFDVFGPAAVEGPRGVMILSPVFVDTTIELS